MQNYYLESGKIVVTNLNEFNTKHILECGQVFRYKKFDDHYEVYSQNKKAKIYSYPGKVEILTSSPEYFVNYFDLNTNYTDIKQKLAQFEVLKPMLKFAYGIRILKQNEFEMMISFVISANNNIKRIQSIIEKMCEKFGTFDEKQNFYAFPTREQLLNATVDDFKLFGAGYRAEYLFNIIRQLENFDYDFVKNNQSEKVLPVLLNLSGVGPKVADCILLFGFNKPDVFPVDTWIIKVYNQYFAKDFKKLESIKNIDKSKNENNLVINNANLKQNQKIKSKFDVKQIRKNLVSIFGNLSGYAQQYLFYYKRSGQD